MKFSPAGFLSLFALPISIALVGCGGGGEAPTEAPPAEAMEETVAAPEVVEEPAPAPKPVTDVDIIIKTEMGDMPATIYATKTPITAANFLNLAKRGYYEGVEFHRVEPGFVIQGGDPTVKMGGDPKLAGRGGPGYTIPLEVVPDFKHDRAGVLSMARKSDPDTAGSQFFVTLDAAPHLDDGYAIFGAVTSNAGVAQSITKGDRIKEIEILGDPEPLFEQEAERIVEWNATLDKNFPAAP